MSLKIAIVGVGKVATQNYLPYLVQHTDLQLRYYNRTPEKAVAAAQQFGGQAMTTLAELMADEPDAILILTNEQDRLAAASALLDFRPQRLFFEKPLVAQQGQANVVEDDFVQARALLQRAHSLGTETAMVFNYRFFDQTIKARDLIASHNLGQPVHCTGLVHYACWSHSIDLLLEFMGPVRSVSALGNQQPRPWGAIQATDVTAALHFHNDATGTIIGTCGLDFKLPLYELTFAFERGRIHLRDLDGDLELIDYTTGHHEIHALSRNVSRWDQYRASFGKAVNAYLAAVRAGAPPPVPGVAGLRELQFEAALKRSIAQGRPVTVDEEFPLSGEEIVF